MRPRQIAVLCFVIHLCATAGFAIRRDPNGVNVNAQGATTVFITFGDLHGQVPVEAQWCGELISAAPDIGMRCRPDTIFGRLPIRFDRSRLASDGSAFTDVMSIPPSVSRRAYQAARRGEHSAFFYVRRFASTTGGPDEYVFVTCRMAGGGARVPLALLHVALRFEGDAPVQSVESGGVLPRFEAEVFYNGTGHLQGRWEVVLPGDDPPTSHDLLTEATLPQEERALQRRYTEVSRFRVFLNPTGKTTLRGPDPALLPTNVGGLHQILLRVEAANDKEGDSNRALAGAGVGIVHSGAAAGFPLPVLRYFVGSLPSGAAPRDLVALTPAEGATIAESSPLVVSWQATPSAGLYRLEVADTVGNRVFSAALQQGIGSYEIPRFVGDRSAGELRWRVVALELGGDRIGETAWRRVHWRRAQPTKTDQAASAFRSGEARPIGEN